MRAAPDGWPLHLARLEALPPAHLINYRIARYAGGTGAVSLAAFAPADQAGLRALYQMLTALWGLLTAAPLIDWPVLPAVRAALGRSGWYEVLAALPQVGTTTHAQPHPDPLDAVLAAVRAGNFAVLRGTLPLLGLGPVPPDALLPLLGLVRDHLHTLRNLVPDLDPAGAAADQVPQPQALDHLVAKWRHPPYGVGHTACDVRVGVHLTGAVAAHPRERAAVDGVLTTLIMQAMRWAADGIVYVVLVPHGAGQDVRAVVYHRHAARADLPQDRGRGWTRCAAYVADCYGLPTVQQCLAAQYLAADVIDGYGVAWFHWPLVPPTHAR